MIMTKWLGPNWEDRLEVWKEYYREEHQYCESEDCLREIVRDYARSGAAVLESKLVPIGRWCVHWWKRFASGFRLELKIGVP
jgi:hypothetical protein